MSRVERKFAFLGRRGREEALKEAGLNSKGERTRHMIKTIRHPSQSNQTELDQIGSQSKSRLSLILSADFAVIRLSLSSQGFLEIGF